MLQLRQTRLVRIAATVTRKKSQVPITVAVSRNRRKEDVVTFSLLLSLCMCTSDMSLT